MKMAQRDTSLYVHRKLALCLPRKSAIIHKTIAGTSGAADEACGVFLLCWNQCTSATPCWCGSVVLFAIPLSLGINLRLCIEQ